MFENMSNGVTMFEPQNDGQEFLIADFNTAAEQIENISRKDVLGREVREVFPGIADFGLFEVLQRVYATGKAEHFSAGEYKDDRVEGWRENFTYKLSSDEVVTIYNDVTDRKRMEDELNHFASIDFLTGIPNRRQLMETLDRELNRAQRYGRTLSFLMFDLDHFKSINDRYGHEAGDKVLPSVAKSCKNTLRKVDEVGRIGGEEFAVILPDTRSEGAMEVAERLRCQVENLVVATESGDVSVTISIGVVEASYGKSDLACLMRKADDAMYAAKHEGRNRTVVATEDEHQGSC